MPIHQGVLWEAENVERVLRGCLKVKSSYILHLHLTTASRPTEAPVNYLELSDQLYMRHWSLKFFLLWLCQLHGLYEYSPPALLSFPGQYNLMLPSLLVVSSSPYAICLQSTGQLYWQWCSDILNSSSHFPTIHIRVPRLYWSMPGFLGHLNRCHCAAYRTQSITHPIVSFCDWHFVLK